MAHVRCNCGLLLRAPPGVPTVRCSGCYALVNCLNNNGYAAVVPATTPEQYNGYSNNYYPNYKPTGYAYSRYGNNSYPNYNPTGYAYGGYQQPPQPFLQPSPLSVYGRKRAVLIGINYHGHDKSLKGSINDARSMRNFLVNWLGFPNESVLLLTEEEKDPYRIPTRLNIQMALCWLVQGCQSGDSLVFHFSGHGSQVPDHDGDEDDGLDESLCPVDYEIAGKILDDEINATIVRPLAHGVILHAIIDTCASGTFLDLPYMCRMYQQGYHAWQPRTSAVYKSTSGGTALCFSACDDHETSIDTTAFTSNTAAGAMTYSFIQAVQNERGLTYSRLLHSIRAQICEFHKRIYGPYAPILQVPQLSSTEAFDIHSKLFVV